MDPRIEHAAAADAAALLFALGRWAGRGGAGVAVGRARRGRARRADTGAVCRACRTSRRKAKRVIYLFQSGARRRWTCSTTSRSWRDVQGSELPDSMRKGQRLTGMTSRQASFPIAASKFKFAQHGQSGAWVSELLPHTARVADELCFIKSMHTEAINHDPAITFFQTGAQLAGRPSIGSWLSYGLGSENHDLPAFVVMISQGSGNPTDQPLYDRLWGSGFLPIEVSGRQVPLGRRSGAVSLESAGHRRRTRGGGCSTTWRSSTN